MAVPLKLTPRVVLLDGVKPCGVCATTAVIAVAIVRNVVENIIDQLSFLFQTSYFQSKHYYSLQEISIERKND